MTGTAAVTVRELLDCTAAENARWAEWFAAHSASLDRTFDEGHWETVRDVVAHVAFIENRDAAILGGRAVPASGKSNGGTRHCSRAWPSVADDSRRRWPVPRGRGSCSSFFTPPDRSSQCEVRMGEDWSPEEVAATVADYFIMLNHELRGEPFSKREHNRHLQLLLRGRSTGAIEFKHANISAVLSELGMPYIEGYKPRSNYQELLADEVAARLDLDSRVTAATEEIVEADVGTPSSRELTSIPFVPAPKRDADPGKVAERRVMPRLPRRNVNYLDREAKNTSLGFAGEVFAMQAEHQRLWESGERHLAERIEHVSQTRGDGLGYDILSFESDGRERLIEVKTTNFGIMTPFFASRKEVAVSEDQGPRFNLYRVFGFRRTPQVFVLEGSLRLSCRLDPLQFQASVR